MMIDNMHENAYAEQSHHARGLQACAFACVVRLYVIWLQTEECVVFSCAIIRLILIRFLPHQAVAATIHIHHVPMRRQ